jgi:hypothetical protein
MKFLNKQIKTKRDIESYIDSLVSNDLMYHFDDNARDIVSFEENLSQEHLDLLDIRTNEMLDIDYDYAFEYALKIMHIPW